MTLLLLRTLLDEPATNVPHLVGGGLSKTSRGEPWKVTGFNTGISPSVGSGGQLTVLTDNGTQVGFGSVTVDSVLANRGVSIAVDALPSALDIWFYKAGKHIGANNSAVIGGTVYVSWVVV
jgi:hypothetical protein